MVQIVKDPMDWQSALASGLGSSLGGGLQTLAQTKLNQVQQRNQQQRFEKAGYPQQLAGFLSNFNPDQQIKLINNLWQSGGIPQEGMSEQQEGIQQQNPQLQPQEQSQQFPEVQQAFQQVQQAPQINKPQTAAQILSGKPRREQREDEKLNIAKQKLANAQRKQEHNERIEAFKNTEGIRKEIYKQAQQAREGLRTAEEMEELEKEGLDSPGYIKFLKNADLDISNLKNAATQQFEKLAAQSIRGIKEVFGGKVSNLELQAWQASIPSLLQSPEGRKRVLSDIKYLNGAKIAYMDASKEIIKKNNNRPPDDLLEQIDDKIGKKLDELTKKFKEDLAKPVPGGQNKIVTVLQALAGKALGGILSGAKSTASSGFGGKAAAHLLEGLL
jgi:hypothetical protein